MACIILYKKTHNDTIVEISISTSSKSDWKSSAEPFLSLLKAYIPVSHREYDPKAKVWEIAKEYFEAIKIACSGLNLQLKEKIEYDHSTPYGQPNVKVDAAYAENFFYESTSVAPAKTDSRTLKQKLEVLLGVSITTQPIDELKKLYRRKAMEYHPDRNNGDGSRMSELNSVWSEYSR